MDFNPRPRKEGDSQQRLARQHGQLFQSTPSQRGRREHICSHKYYTKISIHALAKRATQYQTIILIRPPFQSTPSQRGRLLPWFTATRRAVISIHALAKRATFADTYSPLIVDHFNPRPRKEGDQSKKIDYRKKPIFQSTPSQRGRQQIYTMIIYILKLNITFRTFFLYKIIKN